MALDWGILHWIQNNITCPFLDAVMQAFTCFGEELAFLLLALTGGAMLLAL